MFDKIPIVLAFNKPYTLPALVTIKSLCQHISDKKRVEFFIFHKNLDHNTISLVSEIVSGYGFIVDFIKLAGSLDEYDKPSSVTDEVFYPLFIMKYFHSYKRVIFLDADLLIRDDILKLVDLFPSNKKMGGTQCFFRNYIRYGDFCDFNVISREAVGIKNTERYVNSGVLIFNMNAITNEEGQKALDLISQKWPSNEESILNHLFQHDLALLPIEWNFQMELFDEDPAHFSPSIKPYFRSARSDIKICHFMGYSKPWLHDRNGHPPSQYKREWLDTAQEVMQDIDLVASRILCGSMWQKIKNVQAESAHLPHHEEI